MTSTTLTKRISIRIALAYACALFLVPTAIIALDRSEAEALRDEVYGSMCAVFDAPRCATEGGEDTNNAGTVEGDTDNGAGEDPGMEDADARESEENLDENADTGDTESESTDSTVGNTGGSSGSISSDTSMPSGNVAVVVQSEDKMIRTLYSLPSDEEATVPVTSTNKNHTVEVSAHSALSALLETDDASSAFAVSDLVYYPSFTSFFLNCLTITGEEEQCGQWQYSVNGTYPSVGLDAYRLTEGDTLYLFYGSTRRVEAPDTVQTRESFSVGVQQYNPVLGSYVGVGGYTVGVVQDNPTNPWEPTVVALAETDTKGNATFTLTEVGAYGVGIKEDFYYPTTPFTVRASGGGGGIIRSGSVLQDKSEFTRSVFNVPDALSFVRAQALPDGTFGAPLYTDWAVIALASAGDELQMTRAFLERDTPVYTNVTDHIRRSMALMAVGLSPYDGSPVNHIATIRGYFGGMQFGDPLLVNDDIFALVVLERAGYGVNDPLIAHTISFLLDTQKDNGSWEGSVDLTAAAVQALVPFATYDGVDVALFKARAFLILSQDADGGFGDVFATSWVVQAMYALGENPATWKKASTTPLEYLASQQEKDGGVLAGTEPSTNRLWATSYAVPAVLGKTWREILTAYTQPTGTVVITESTLVRASGFDTSPNTQSAKQVAEGAVVKDSTITTNPQDRVNSVSSLSAVEEKNEAEGVPSEIPAEIDAYLAIAGSESKGHFANALRMLGLVFFIALAVYVYVVFRTRRMKKV